MCINFSNNALSDFSIKYFSDTLRNYNCFRSVQMRTIMQNSTKSDVAFGELGKALRKNYALQDIDMRGNSISEQSIAKIFTALSENYVLLELKIDIHKKKLPSGF